MYFYHLTTSSIDSVTCFGDQCNDGKPGSAFWCCPDNSWLHWLASQQAWDDDEFHRNIKLLAEDYNIYRVGVDMSQVLVCRNEEDAQQVFSKYGFVYDTGFGFREAIDWIQVSKKWKAIYIAFTPLGHYRVDGLEWLSGWDVKSIAIWDPSIIKKFILTE